MVLSERQQLARRLVDDLVKMCGVWVDSPLPLNDGAALRVHVLETERAYFLQVVRDFGFEPTFLTIKPRVCAVGFNEGTSLWEIELPCDKPIPQDDRAIPKDDVGRRAQSAETKAMLEAIYGKQRR